MNTVSAKIPSINTGRSQTAPVYATLLTLAMIGIVLAILGILPIIPFLGMEFSLVFIGIFLTNLRLFILIYFGLRTLLELFMEPTRIAIGNSSIQLVGVMGAIVLAGGLIYIIMNHVRIKETSIVGPMILFLGMSLPVLLLLSPEKMIGLKDWIGTASAFIIFVLIATTFKTKRDLMLLLRVIVLSTIIPLSFGFYQLLTNSGNQRTLGFNRINGTFIHPNPYAFYLVVMLLVCVPLLLESKKKWERPLYGTLMLLMSISLVFTYARAAWLSLILGIVILAVVRYRKLFLVTPLVVVILPILVPSIIDRFQEALGFSQGKGSMFFRVELWSYLLPYFYDNPILGAGLGGFTNYVEKGLGFVYMAHNDYLRVLIDTGIVGLIGYLAIWLGLARESIRAYLNLQDEIFKVMGLIVLAIVGAYLAMSATDNMFRFSLIQSYIWCLGGIVAAAARLEFPNGMHGSKSAKQLVLPGIE